MADIANKNMPPYETDIILQFEIVGSTKHKLRFVVRGNSLEDVKNKAKELHQDVIKSLEDLRQRPGITNQSIKLGGEEGLELYKG
jgi:hypothetical protein